MSNTFLRAVLAVYPRGFRRRYGPEVQGLVNDLEAAGDRSRLRLVSGLLVSAVAERLRTVRLDARLTIPTLAAVAALGTIVGAAGPAAPPATALGRAHGATHGRQVERGRTRGSAGDGARGADGATHGGQVERGRTCGSAGDGARRADGATHGGQVERGRTRGSAGDGARRAHGATHGGHVERQKQNCRCPTEQHSRLRLRTPSSGLAPSALTRGRHRWIRRAIRKPAADRAMDRVRPRHWARASLRSRRRRRAER